MALDRTENVPHLVGIPTYVQNKVEIAWFAEVSFDSGVRLEIERLVAEKQRYYTGQAIYDHTERGLNVKVAFGMDDYSINGLRKAHEFLDIHSKEINKLRMRAQLGRSLRKHGFPVVLRPFDANDDSNDIILYLCNSITGLVLDFNAEGDAPDEIEYQAYPIFTLIEEQKVDENGELVVDDEGQPVMVKNRYLDYGHIGPWEEDYIAKEGHFFTAEETFDGKAV